MAEAQTDDFFAERWVIYDSDADELVTTIAYASYEEACEDARELSNTVVVSLGKVANKNNEEER